MFIFQHHQIYKHTICQIPNKASQVQVCRFVHAFNVFVGVFVCLPNMQTTTAMMSSGRGSSFIAMADFQTACKKHHSGQTLNWFYLNGQYLLNLLPKQRWSEHQQQMKRVSRGIQSASKTFLKYLPKWEVRLTYQVLWKPTNQHHNCFVLLSFCSLSCEGLLCTQIQLRGLLYLIRR